MRAANDSRFFCDEPIFYSRVRWRVSRYKFKFPAQKLRQSINQAFHIIIDRYKDVPFMLLFIRILFVNWNFSFPIKAHSEILHSDRQCLRLWRCLPFYSRVVGVSGLCSVRLLYWLETQIRLEFLAIDADRSSVSSCIYVYISIIYEIGMCALLAFKSAVDRSMMNRSRALLCLLF